MKLPGKLVLVGHPVAHSLSPAMQNAALEAANIPLRYEAIDVPPENLSSSFDALAAAHGAGNITIPHKEAARRLMSRVSAMSRRVGAINTFHTSVSGKLIGDNTDVAGFKELVRYTLGGIPRNARVAIIGAGGAAAAVLAAIEQWDNVRATLYARRLDSARNLARRFNVVERVNTIPRDGRIDCDIVVNATSVGLSDDEVPISLDSIPGDAAVLDLVYRPGQTAWVRDARATGRPASDGLPMLVEQGAVSFEIWFGKPPDRDLMWQAVKEAAHRL